MSSRAPTAAARGQRLAARPRRTRPPGLGRRQAHRRQQPPQPQGGALIGEAGPARIVKIAERVGAWVLCDEVYRGVDQDGDGFTASIADLYERGISTGGMSKPYSLAGLRLGWIVGPTRLLAEGATHRDYTTIGVGRVDDLLACVALENKDAVLARSHQITRPNLAILDEWVTGRDDITYVKPASGTTALLRCNALIDSYEFCTRLLGETGSCSSPAPPSTSSPPSASASPTTPRPCAPAWNWSASSSTASPRTDSPARGERSRAMGQATARTVTRLQGHQSAWR